MSKLSIDELQCLLDGVEEVVAPGVVEQLREALVELDQRRKESDLLILSSTVNTRSMVPYDPPRLDTTFRRVVGSFRKRIRFTDIRGYWYETLSPVEVFFDAEIQPSDRLIECSNGTE